MVNMEFCIVRRSHRLIMNYLQQSLTQIFKHDFSIYDFVGENESPLLKIIDSIGGVNKLKIESRNSECNDRKYCPIEAIETELSARYKQILDKEASFELVTDLRGIFNAQKNKISSLTHTLSEWIRESF